MAMIAKMITGPGTPKKLPLPNRSMTALSEAKWIGVPLEISRAKPLATAIAASVMMNGCIPRNVTPMPLASPIAVPTSSANTSAAGTPKPALTVIEKMMPTSARIEPTERSMPAVSTTNVMPTATTPVSEAWRATLIRFPGLKNTGARTLVTASMSTNRTRITL